MEDGPRDRARLDSDRAGSGRAGSGRVRGGAAVRHRWATIAGAVALVALAVEFAVAVPMRHTIGQLVDWIRSAGVIGVAAYAAVYIVFTVLLIPGSLLTAGAGLAYGPWLGLLLVSPVSVAAATLSFVLGRTVARGWITRRIAVDPRFRAVDAAIGRRGFRIVLLLRLSPLFPFNVLNYALGLTDVRLRDFILASFLGMLPGTFLYVYLGSLVSNVASLSAAGDAGGGARRFAYLGWPCRHGRRHPLRHAGGAACAPDGARPGMTTRPFGSSLILPDDRHNRALLAQVHPAGWTNPKPARRYNLVVIGAGTAGLVSAVGAASLGATVAIVERCSPRWRLPQRGVRAVEGPPQRGTGRGGPAGRGCLRHLRRRRGRRGLPGGHGTDATVAGRARPTTTPLPGCRASESMCSSATRSLSQPTRSPWGPTRSGSRRASSRPARGPLCRPFPASMPPRS